MMYWWGPGMSGWGYALMSVSMVLFWGLVILGDRCAGEVPGPLLAVGRRAGVPRATAEQVLAERFARGEIDEQEYQSRLATLRGRQQSTSGT